MANTSSSAVPPLLRGKFVYVDRCVLCRADEQQQLRQLERRIKAMRGTITDNLENASYVLVMPLRTVLDSALQSTRGEIVYFWFLDHAYDARALPDPSAYKVSSATTYPYAFPVPRPLGSAAGARTPAAPAVAGRATPPVTRARSAVQTAAVHKEGSAAPSDGTAVGEPATAAEPPAIPARGAKTAKKMPSPRNKFTYDEVRQWAKKAVTWLACYTHLSAAVPTTIIKHASAFLYKAVSTLDLAQKLREDLKTSSLINIYKVDAEYKEELLKAARAGRSRANSLKIKHLPEKDLERILDAAAATYRKKRDSLRLLQAVEEGEAHESGESEEEEEEEGAAGDKNETAAIASHSKKRARSISLMATRSSARTRHQRTLYPTPVSQLPPRPPPEPAPPYPEDRRRRRNPSRGGPPAPADGNPEHTAMPTQDTALSHGAATPPRSHTPGEPSPAPSTSVDLDHAGAQHDGPPPSALVVFQELGTAYANACCLLVNFDGRLQDRASVGAVLTAALKPSAQRVCDHLRFVLEFFPDAGVHSGTSLLPDGFDITTPRHEACPLDPVGVLDCSAHGYVYHGRISALVDPPCLEIPRMLLPPHAEDIQGLCADVGQSGDTPIIPILIEYRDLELPFSPVASPVSTPAITTAHLSADVAQSSAGQAQSSESRDQHAQVRADAGPTDELPPTPPAPQSAGPLPTSLPVPQPVVPLHTQAPAPRGRGGAQGGSRATRTQYTAGTNTILHALIFDRYPDQASEIAFLHQCSHGNRAQTDGSRAVVGTGYATLKATLLIKGVLSAMRLKHNNPAMVMQVFHGDLAVEAKVREVTAELGVPYGTFKNWRLWADPVPVLLPLLMDLGDLPPKLIAVRTVWNSLLNSCPPDGDDYDPSSCFFTYTSSQMKRDVDIMTDELSRRGITIPDTHHVDSWIIRQSGGDPGADASLRLHPMSLSPIDEDSDRLVPHVFQVSAVFRRSRGTAPPRLGMDVADGSHVLSVVLLGSALRLCERSAFEDTSLIRVTLMERRLGLWHGASLASEVICVHELEVIEPRSDRVGGTLIPPRCFAFRPLDPVAGVPDACAVLRSLGHSAFQAHLLASELLESSTTAERVAHAARGMCIPILYTGPPEEQASIAQLFLAAWMSEESSTLAATRLDDIADPVLRVKGSVVFAGTVTLVRYKEDATMWYPICAECRDRLDDDEETCPACGYDGPMRWCYAVEYTAEDSSGRAVIRLLDDTAPRVIGFVANDLPTSCRLLMLFKLFKRRDFEMVMEQSLGRAWRVKLMACSEDGQDFLRVVEVVQE
ncbi:hypothetical protein AURDEDRAFT_131236 [Auricularia subglabra TFB-10046 SS5]|uniref:Uncharacterized protein n=1 Tax=Auricularia subglabra (strain TFB-10046 / SS5) TaxID=717982 RepID=J0D631_AURST|nr:hypothetical protein AURDEDRAFT_131236 [Auricularia subglabra TFB-10046 SS5]